MSNELQLYPWLKITDVKKFLESHEAMSKNPNPRFAPYLDRLNDVKRILKNKDGQ